MNSSVLLQGRTHVKTHGTRRKQPPRIQENSLMEY